jgi:hypothetical protein
MFHSGEIFFHWFISLHYRKRECYELYITNPTHIRNCFYLGQITHDHLMLCYIKVFTVIYRHDVGSWYCTRWLLTDLWLKIGDNRYSVLRKMVILFFMSLTKVLPILQTDIFTTSFTIKIGTLFPLIKLTTFERNFYKNMKYLTHQNFSGSDIRKCRNIPFHYWTN